VNTKEIIESGKLELYVCGALSEREMREIALLADLNTDLRQEIARIENDLVNYAESFEKEPSDDSYNRLMKTLKSGSKTFQVDFKNNNFNWAYAATVVGFLLMSSVAFYFWRQSQLMEKEISSLMTLNDSISSLKKEVAYTEKNIQFLDRPDTRKFKLVGIDGKDSTNNFILVYWCPVTEELMVSPGNLPKPPDGKQYQLWAMVDGRAIDAGMINMTPVQKMKNVSKAEAFGVTLENAGGNSSPNMDGLVVMRKI
jgi:anti-sigma-K factor RskA